MKDNSLNCSDSGCSNEIKAVSGLFFFVNEALRNFLSFVQRTRDGQAGGQGQSNVNRQAEKKYHQKNREQMPLEQLIKTGFYPFS